MRQTAGSQIGGACIANRCAARASASHQSSRRAFSAAWCMCCAGSEMSGERSARTRAPPQSRCPRTCSSSSMATAEPSSANQQEPIRTRSSTPTATRTMPASGQGLSCQSQPETAALAARTQLHGARGHRHGWALRRRCCTRLSGHAPADDRCAWARCRLSRACSDSECDSRPPKIQALGYSHWYRRPNILGIGAET